MRAMLLTYAENTRDNNPYMRCYRQSDDRICITAFGPLATFTVNSSGDINLTVVETTTKKYICVDEFEKLIQYFHLSPNTHWITLSFIHGYIYGRCDSESAKLDLMNRKDPIIIRIHEVFKFLKQLNAVYEFPITAIMESDH